MFGTDAAVTRRCWLQAAGSRTACGRPGDEAALAAIAQRLVADGQSVIDVPSEAAGAGTVFATGQARKIDATDAHSVAVVALRTEGQGASCVRDRQYRV
jgi:hypothetical protein